ncbi:hypothetical protein P775_15990 [Puniceibacterium antarcticum]|uniref:SsuA/THI5-like domain-containing protein n=1 Tax=Puniceibacterium antarcticum TaxID=1206336 RepID=A0A2G8RC98_9RHOB|nr:ABC transporter substrate-binding protein [Puniceibacterium antarcticum]PIL19167.1 hypothetical protein P775_15990 [Puniceibacterium antarcticum]
MRILSFAAALMGAFVSAADGADAQNLRIGYWSSGSSLGFGSFLKEGGYLEAQGFDVTFVTFPDVNAPTKALAAGGIDFAIGASAGGAMSVTADGLPMSIILATQVADLKFVVPKDSAITKMEDLSGKKIGMSPAGSATASISTAILDKNYGISGSDLEAVPGNDSRLAQFLVQGDIDAAALRTVSLALLRDQEFREIGSFKEEWAKITGAPGAPILAVGVVRNAWLDEFGEEGAARIIAGMRNALADGSANKDKVISALVNAAALSESDADAYATLWDDIYIVTMTPDDVKSLSTTFDTFKEVGVLSGDFAEDAVLTAPFEISKSID